MSALAGSHIRVGNLIQSPATLSLIYPPTRKKERHMILRLKQALGTIFLLIGVAGVFLPLMPGTIFIILGIGLLGSEHKLVVKIKNVIGHRFQPPEKREKKDEGVSTIRRKCYLDNVNLG
jgi:hypothetical protein